VISSGCPEKENPNRWEIQQKGSTHKKYFTRLPFWTCQQIKAVEKNNHAPCLEKRKGPEGNLDVKGERDVGEGGRGKSRNKGGTLPCEV